MMVYGITNRPGRTYHLTKRGSSFAFCGVALWMTSRLGFAGRWTVCRRCRNASA